MIVDLEPFLVHYNITHNPSRRGNQMISCPNPEHEDNHPSTSVHLDKGVWNCQGCGEGGSAVDLVMIIEGVDVREALRITESMVGGDDQQIPQGSGRNRVGLPNNKGDRRGASQPVQAWRGFRT